MAYLVETMRTDPLSFAFFVQHYLVCVLHRGQNTLKHNVPSNVFTICDETMILWYLENSSDTWLDMMETGNTKRSEVKPNFTVSGDRGGSHRFGGWNNAGKARYNELFDMVEMDRKTNGATFDDHYKMAFHRTGQLNKKRKASEAVPDNAPPPQMMRNTLSMLYSNESTAQPPVNTATSNPASVSFPPRPIAPPTAGTHYQTDCSSLSTAGPTAVTLAALLHHQGNPLQQSTNI